MSGNSLDFQALFEASGGTPEEQSAAVKPAEPIDFAALHEQTQVGGNVSTAPVTPADGAAATATNVANKVATDATAVSEAIAPGVSQTPVSSGSETTVLGIENDAAAILKLFPPLAGYSGLVLPAEIVTHLVYAFVGLFKHHVSSQSAAASPTASVLQKG